MVQCQKPSYLKNKRVMFDLLSVDRYRLVLVLVSSASDRYSKS